MVTGTTGPAGPVTKSFDVKSRITHPIEHTTVQATTREDAIAQMVATAAADGDDIEVMDVQETLGGAGATGATGTTAHARAAKS